VVTGLAPAVGPLGGCNSVKIYGSGFSGTTQVTFGSNPAGSQLIYSDTYLVAMTPPGVAGTVNVRVTTPLGTSGISPSDGYTYANVATVDFVKPQGGPRAGGISVTLTGIGFYSVTSVAFGRTPAASFTIKDDNHIMAVSPAGSGLVYITVSNVYGTSAATSQDKFTYR
jgi:hypothetical protein